MQQTLAQTTARCDAMQKLMEAQSEELERLRSLIEATHRGTSQAEPSASTRTVPSPSKGADRDRRRSVRIRLAAKDELDFCELSGSMWEAPPLLLGLSPMSRANSLFSFSMSLFNVILQSAIVVIIAMEVSTQWLEPETNGACC
jgi:hypothetical protein